MKYLFQLRERLRPNSNWFNTFTLPRFGKIRFCVFFIANFALVGEVIGGIPGLFPAAGTSVRAVI